VIIQDLSDLFGSDIPCIDENGSPTFEWRDGPILKAIKEGSWVLLDEVS
jgi:midasin